MKRYIIRKSRKFIPSNDVHKKIMIMRNRGFILLVENDKVALIQRTKDDAVYYVFPGGGIEHVETLEAGVKRGGKL